MHVDRLRLLANTLLADRKKMVKDKTFDMDYWIKNDPNICGTVCCAFGRAAMIPEFNELGLEIWGRTGSDVVYNDGDVNPINLTAAEKFFDITYDQSRHLFYPKNYLGHGGDWKHDPYYVACRILNLINDPIPAFTPIEPAS